MTIDGIGKLSSGDYLVTGYANNTAVGTASVTVQGKGNYTGAATGHFSITALDFANAIISNPGDQTYTGSAITPSVSVTYNSLQLSVGTDYIISYSNNVNPGTGTVVATGIGNYSGTKNAVFAIVTGDTPMYRMYNPNSGEHFYTASAPERDYLSGVGWNYEGLGWTAPDAYGDEVYRLYNPNAGDHHYTLSAAERDYLTSVGWSYEGVGWCSESSKSAPLYRLYNPNAVAGSHHYTTSAGERDSLVSAGWNDEGVGWYGK